MIGISLAKELLEKYIRACTENNIPPDQKGEDLEAYQSAYKKDENAMNAIDVVSLLLSRVMLKVCAFSFQYNSSTPPPNHLNNNFNSVDSSLNFQSLLILDLLFQTTLSTAPIKKEIQLFLSSKESLQEQEQKLQQQQKQEDKIQYIYILSSNTSIKKEDIPDKIDRQSQLYKQYRLHEILLFIPYLNNLLNSAWSNIRSLAYGLLCYWVKPSLTDYPNDKSQSYLSDTILTIIEQLVTNDESECRTGGLNILGSLCGLGYNFEGVDTPIQNYLSFFRRSESLVKKELWCRIYAMQFDWDTTNQAAALALIQLCAPKQLVKQLHIEQKMKKENYYKVQYKNRDWNIFVQQYDEFREIIEVYIPQDHLQFPSKKSDIPLNNTFNSQELERLFWVEKLNNSDLKDYISMFRNEYKPPATLWIERAASKSEEEDQIESREGQEGVGISEDEEVIAADEVSPPVHVGGQKEKKGNSKQTLQMYIDQDVMFSQNLKGNKILDEHHLSTNQEEEEEQEAIEENEEEDCRLGAVGMDIKSSTKPLAFMGPVSPRDFINKKTEKEQGEMDFILQKKKQQKQASRNQYSEELSPSKDKLIDVSDETKSEGEVDGIEEFDETQEQREQIKSQRFVEFKLQRDSSKKEKEEEGEDENEEEQKLEGERKPDLDRETHKEEAGEQLQSIKMKREKSDELDIKDGFNNNNKGNYFIRELLQSREFLEQDQHSYQASLPNKQNNIAIDIGSNNSNSMNGLIQPPQQKLTNSLDDEFKALEAQKNKVQNQMEAISINNNNDKEDSLKGESLINHPPISSDCKSTLSMQSDQSQQYTNSPTQQLIKQAQSGSNGVSPFQLCTAQQLNNNQMNPFSFSFQQSVPEQYNLDNIDENQESAEEDEEQEAYKYNSQDYLSAHQQQLKVEAQKLYLGEDNDKNQLKQNQIHSAEFLISSDTDNGETHIQERNKIANKMNKNDFIYISEEDEFRNSPFKESNNSSQAKNEYDSNLNAQDSQMEQDIQPTNKQFIDNNNEDIKGSFNDQVANARIIGINNSEPLNSLFSWSLKSPSKQEEIKGKKEGETNSRKINSNINLQNNYAGDKPVVSPSLNEQQTSTKHNRQENFSPDDKVKQKQVFDQSNLSSFQASLPKSTTSKDRTKEVAFRRSVNHANIDKNSHNLYSQNSNGNSVDNGNQATKKRARAWQWQNDHLQYMSVSANSCKTTQNSNNNNNKQAEKYFKAAGYKFLSKNHSANNIFQTSSLFNTTQNTSNSSNSDLKLTHSSTNKNVVAASKEKLIKKLMASKGQLDAVEIKSIIKLHHHTQLFFNFPSVPNSQAQYNLQNAQSIGTVSNNIGAQVFASNPSTTNSEHTSQVNGTFQPANNFNSNNNNNNNSSHQSFHANNNIQGKSSVHSNGGANNCQSMQYHLKNNYLLQDNNQINIKNKTSDTSLHKKLAAAGGAIDTTLPAYLNEPSSTQNNNKKNFSRSPDKTESSLDESSTGSCYPQSLHLYSSQKNKQNQEKKLPAAAMASLSTSKNNQNKLLEKQNKQLNDKLQLLQQQQMQFQQQQQQQPQQQQQNIHRSPTPPIQLKGQCELPIQQKKIVAKEDILQPEQQLQQQLSARRDRPQSTEKLRKPSDPIKQSQSQQYLQKKSSSQQQQLPLNMLVLAASQKMQPPFNFSIEKILQNSNNNSMTPSLNNNSNFEQNQFEQSSEQNQHQQQQQPQIRYQSDCVPQSVNNDLQQYKQLIKSKSKQDIISSNSLTSLPKQNMNSTSAPTSALIGARSQLAQSASNFNVQKPAKKQRNKSSKPQQKNEIVKKKAKTSTHFIAEN